MKCLAFCTSCCFKEKKEVRENPFLKQDYMRFIKKAEVRKEIELVKMDIKEADEDLDPAYKERLRQKKRDFKAYQKQVLENKEEDKDGKFIATFSFDIRHNERFSTMLGIDEKLKLKVESEYNSQQIGNLPTSNVDASAIGQSGERE